MAPTNIGRRLYELRTDRVPRLTQQDLAERAGISVDVIQKLEQGRKQSARIPTLHAIAQALDTDLAALVGKATHLESAPVDGGLLELRRVICPVTDQRGGDPRPDLVDLQAAWQLYWHGEYDQLAVLLPAMIRQADRDLLAQTLQLAACLLVHLGHGDLAYTAVSRALGVVEDPLRRATLVGTHGWVLLSQGRPDDAAVVAVRGADEAEPRLTTAEPPQVSAWGNLLITAATSQARAGQGDQARELLRAAGAAAAWLGGDRNDLETVFGPSQVAMQTVDVAVVGGDYAAALDAAESMPQVSALPVAARARHMTDVAHAQVRLGRYEAGEETVLATARLAPQWMRYQPFPKAVVGELLGARRPSARLRTLADRLGVTAT